MISAGDIRVGQLRVNMHTIRRELHIVTRIARETVHTACWFNDPLLSGMRPIKVGKLWIRKYTEVISDANKK